MSEEIKIPSNNKYLESKRQESKKTDDIQTVFDEFKKLLKDKTHPENQTLAYKKNIEMTMNRLLSTADAMDTETPGQGIFGLITLSLMSILKLKDEIVKLEVKNRELEREIKRRNKQPNER